MQASRVPAKIRAVHDTQVTPQPRWRIPVHARVILSAETAYLDELPSWIPQGSHQVIEQALRSVFPQQASAPNFYFSVQWPTAPADGALRFHLYDEQQHLLASYRVAITPRLAGGKWYGKRSLHQGTIAFAQALTQP